VSNDRENAIEAAYSSWSLHRGFPRTENQAFNAGVDYQAKHDAAEFLVCMNDLLLSPKGVVPRSCEKFYCAKTGTFHKALKESDNG